MLDSVGPVAGGHTKTFAAHAPKHSRTHNSQLCAARRPFPLRLARLVNSNRKTCCADFLSTSSIQHHACKDSPDIFTFFINIQHHVNNLLTSIQNARENNMKLFRHYMTNLRSKVSTKIIHNKGSG
jgi:hypothetical protein